LFSEGKTTVDVVIALDLAADQVRAIYRQYCDLKHMYELGQIYDEGQYDLPRFLRLHKIVKDLGMEEHDVINVLELAKKQSVRISAMESRTCPAMYPSTIQSTTDVPMAVTLYQLRVSGIYK
jgi:hypothetical protein